MLKHELEGAIGRNFNEDEFNIINTVYMHYPGMNDKEQVYKLFDEFGLVVFDDLYPRARKLAELEHKINQLLAEAEKVETGKLFPYPRVAESS